MRAAAVLKREGILFRLVLIGSGEMEQELRVLATELELNNVDFVGFVNQSRIPKYYAASDVFVLPSRHDGWGVVINQALAAGLPIITSNAVGAGLDLVENGQAAAFTVRLVDGENDLRVFDLRRGNIFAECSEGHGGAVEIEHTGFLRQFL